MQIILGAYMGVHGALYTDVLDPRHAEIGSGIVTLSIGGGMALNNGLTGERG